MPWWQRMALWFVRISSFALGPLYVRIFKGQVLAWLESHGVKEAEMTDWLRSLAGSLTNYRTIIMAFMPGLTALIAYLTGEMGYEEFSTTMWSWAKGMVAVAATMIPIFLRLGAQNDIENAVAKALNPGRLSQVRRILGLVMLLSFAIPSMACASLLYPERRFQECPEYALDWAPAVADGALLLFGVVPGAVAIGVDAGTGALWECRRGELGGVSAPW